MKIGIIGRFDSIHHLDGYIGPDSALVQYKHYPATDENLKDSVELAQKENDALFFAGKAGMRAAETLVSATVPWSCVKRTPTAIKMTFMKAILDGNELNRVSFDLSDYSEERMIGIIAEISEKPSDQISVFKLFNEYIFNYANTSIQFHLNNLRSGKASFAISGSSKVIRTLKEAGYRAYWVAPITEEVQHSINNLIIEYQAQRQRIDDDDMSAVMSIHVEYPKHIAKDPHSSEYYRWDYVVRTSISFFANEFGASLEVESENIYNMYMRKTEVRLATENLTRLDLFYRIKTLGPDTKVCIGIGIGKNPLIAKNNAIVCRNAAISEGCAYFIKEDDGELQGPFWSETKNSGSEEALNRSELERISQESGVGIVNIENISNACRKYGFDTVTPGELAEMCSMSVNNMNRILVNLESSGFIQVVGMKPANIKGRPRRVIRILF